MAAGQGADPPRLRQDLVYRPLVDGAMVYDGRTRLVHHLNASATLVWEAVSQGKCMREVAALLAERYEVAAEVSVADVVNTVSMLGEAGLLEESVP